MTKDQALKVINWASNGKYRLNESSPSPTSITGALRDAERWARRNPFHKNLPTVMSAIQQVRSVA